MDTFTHTVNALLQLLAQLGDLAVSWLKAIELWLRGQLTGLGVPAALQTVIMLALAALLVIAVVRLLGGLTRIVVLLLVLLVVAHALLPILPQRRGCPGAFVPREDSSGHYPPADIVSMTKPAKEERRERRQASESSWRIAPFHTASPLDLQACQIKAP